jgi:hypothetical protein
MEARDVGVRALSRRTGYSAAFISQLRAGKRHPSADAAQDLDDALGAQGNLLASAPAQETADSRRPIGKPQAAEIAAILSALPGSQRSWGGLREQEYDHLIVALVHWASQMKRRDVLAILGAAATAAYASPVLGKLSPEGTERVALAASGRVRADAAVIGHIGAVVDHCMHQEDTLGPQVVLETVLAQQHLVRSLLADGAKENVQARLLSLLANISRFTGWVLFNLNDFTGAGYYYAQARSAAHEADDDAMCSMVLANWSQLATWSGDPRLGVEHALGAVAWGQRAGSKLLVSYGCDVGARAYAAVVRRSAKGDRRADHAHCMKSLEQAHHELANAPDGDPGARLVYFYGDGQYLSTRTGCLLDMDDPEPALAIAEQSVVETDPAFVRNVAITRLAQARAHTQLANIDAACRQVAEAARLARHNSSPRLVSAVAESRETLSPWNGSAAVTVLDDELRAFQLRELAGGIFSSTRMSNTGAGTGGSMILDETFRQPQCR